MDKNVKYREIRQRFPNPVKANKPAQGTYCVGGAVCKGLGDSGQGFPAKETLARVLQARLGVQPVRADYFAERIIKSNDAGEFNKAWDYVAAAMGV